MSCEITASEDGRYILLEVVGEINRRTAMAQNLKAHALGRELGIRRYLVDVTRARNTDTALDDYEFAHRDMQTDGIDVGARVAVLVSPGDRSHEFVETVARNAGMNVRNFEDRDQALRFLLDD